ncbi:unnamed protein product [Adineta steineri]|uniref:Uncharacterized protein n=1 Tax=Adineta steineri TaxID=433720 RepID=A0A813SG27_9BILA|nr:unnamed protein product [Adineta steineri]CAF4032131.1 unnamed protein product [Adineta steineri]
MLYLPYNGFGDNLIQHVAVALLDYKALTKLDLSGNRIGDIGAQHLADALRNHQSSLGGTNPYINQGNRIGDEEAKYFADALKMNKTLTTLNLSRNSIGNIGVKYLSDALQNNTTITILDLSWNRIEDFGVQYLADALRNNQTLINLNLEGNRIQNNGLKYFANALIDNKTLIHLELKENLGSYSPVAGPVIQTRNEKTFTKINLQQNKVGDNEARFLADEFLGELRSTLITPDHQLNRIGDTEAQQIASALKNNEALNKSALVNNKISMELQNRLKTEDNKFYFSVFYIFDD